MLCFVAESRIGRQPNAVKHATFLQLSRIKSAKGIISPNDSFLLSETKPDLTEVGDSDSTVIVDNDLLDFTVTTSHHSQRLMEDKKTSRRPHKKRSDKMTAGLSESSIPSCLSPIEIKQEIDSSAECETNGVFDDFEVELVESFSESGHRQSTEKHPEQVCQPTGMHTQNVDVASDNVHSFSQRLQTDNFQATGSGSAVPRPTASLTACQLDSLNTTVTIPAPSAPASSQMSQPNYEDIVISMQRAYYDLLPILDRV